MCIIKIHSSDLGVGLCIKTCPTYYTGMSLNMFSVYSFLLFYYEDSIYNLYVEKETQFNVKSVFQTYYKNRKIPFTLLLKSNNPCKLREKEQLETVGKHKQTEV